MMNDKREFELGAVISAATGWLVAREGFDAVHELFEYITRGPVWTHQLPRLFEECREGLFEQFPWMRDIVLTKDNFDAANWEQWLDEQVTVHGEFLEVKPLNPGQHSVVNPFKEIVDMMGPDSVVVAIVGE